MSTGTQTQQGAATMIAFARLTKVDEQKRLVFGRAAQQVPDRSDEEMDYAGSKPYFKKWSDSQREASLGKSVGNVRAMHSKVAAGILTPENGIVFNDAEKAVDVCAHVTDDAEWKKVLTGTYTGFSIGGKYVSKGAPDSKGVVRYVADPSEISLVDRPAIPTATFFTVQKADGSEVKVDFKKAEERPLEKIVNPHKVKKDGKTVVVDDDGHEYGSHEDEASADNQVAALHAKKEAGKVAKLNLVRADGVDLKIAIEKDKVPAAGVSFDVGEHTYSLVKVDGDKAIVELVYEVSGSPDDIASFAKALGEANLSISDATALVLAKAAAAAELVKKVEAKARELCKANNLDPEALVKAGDDKSGQNWTLYKDAAQKELEKLAKAEPSAQEAHDAAIAKGAKCAHATLEMTKVDEGELSKAVAAEVAKAVAPVQAALSEANAKIKKLEDQPMPTKVQLALLTKAVDKTTDGLSKDDGGEFQPVRDGRGRIDVVATIMKAQHMGAAGATALRKYVDEEGKLRAGVE